MEEVTFVWGDWGATKVFSAGGGKIKVVLGKDKDSQHYCVCVLGVVLSVWKEFSH